MFRSIMMKIRSTFWRGAQQLLVLGGAMLVTLALGAIVLPFLLGLALLMAAQWATRQSESDAPSYVTKVAVG